MKKLLVKTILITIIFAVLIVSTVPSAAEAYYTSMPASIVIGQSDFTSSSANQNGGGTPAANTLSGPNGIVTIGNKLIITDQTNQRVLVYNAIPTINNQAADVVIGQTDFVSKIANQGSTVKANTFFNPSKLSTDGTKLFVVDQSNNRVLIFNQVPTSNNASADVVVGQNGFTSNSANQGGGTTPGANTVSAPRSVYYDSASGKLVIADGTNNRVLIYNQVPTSNNASADVVVGQADFTHGSVNQGGSASGSTLSSPRSAIIANNSLIVADFNNQRILIWNSVPTTNNKAADVVIGQVDFTHISPNSGNGTVGANGFNGVNALLFDGNRLFEVEANNQRILIYNSIPTTNGASADMVLGEPDFYTNTGGTSATLLTGPQSMYSSNNQLFVADSGNNRAIIYNNTTFSVVTPSINLTTPLTRLPGYKLRALGNVVVGSRGTFSLRSLQVSVNGTQFGNVTHLGGGTDSGNNTSYDFSTDFDPTVGDIGGTTENYTLNFLASDFDTVNTFTNNLFYFLPFTFNSFNVSDTKLQTFTFTVNKNQIQRIKDNLDHFEVWYTKNNTTPKWVGYIPNIAKTQINDNGTVVATKTDGTRFIGSYIFKIVAVDHWQNRQDSDLLYIAGTGPVTKTNYPSFTKNFVTPAPTTTANPSPTVSPVPTPSSTNEITATSNLQLDKSGLLKLIFIISSIAALILLITLSKRRSRL